MFDSGIHISSFVLLQEKIIEQYQDILKKL